jgi:hypothetical protein
VQLAGVLIGERQDRVDRVAQRGHADLPSGKQLDHPRQALRGGKPRQVPDLLALQRRDLPLSGSDRIQLFCLTKQLN